MPRATPVVGDGGFFTVHITPPGGERVDVTMFRNAPTQIGSFSWADPFGPSSAQIEFPQITILEASGQGDLKWLVAGADVDIVYRLSDGTATDWVWEGFIASEEVSATARSISCKGALLQTDNYLQQPQVQLQPVPVEIVIRNAFDPKASPSLRTKPLITEWPDGWPVTVTPADMTKVYNGTNPATGQKLANPAQVSLVPAGVKVGDKWSGSATRDTGSWNTKLALVQEKLKDMIAPDGSGWTVSCRKGRQPVLHVRQMKFRPDADTFHVAAGAPGIDIGTIARDFSQVENVIFGKATGLDGQVYSNMQIAADGVTTYYEPFAALPYVYPAADTSTALAAGVMRREVQKDFESGLDYASAKNVAKAHLARMADPGYTGTITLTTDPVRGGKPVSRFLIRSGDTLQVAGLMGKDILFHVTDVTVNLQELTVEITVDSKYRDAVTVDEVRMRTRDALDPVRLLQLGKFSPTLSDLLLPWSYKEGAGCIPYASAPLFTKLMSATAAFPWTDFTTKYPPKDYGEYYVKIPGLTAAQKAGTAAVNAQERWAGWDKAGNKFGRAIPIYVGQEGNIRLTQIALYDKYGNVVPASFHFSIYKNNNVTTQDMPRIPTAWAKETPYGANQPYPFFKNAWETVDTQGVEFSSDAQYITDATQNSRVAGWGNNVERAGYSPGTASALGNNKTGKLIDENGWSYDTTSSSGVDWKPYDAAAIQKAANDPLSPTPGWLYAMAFCDDIPDDVYLLGRLYRMPEGN